MTDGKRPAGAPDGTTRVYIKSFGVHVTTRGGYSGNSLSRKFPTGADAVAFGEEMERAGFGAYISVDAEVEGWEYSRLSRADAVGATKGTSR